MDKKPTIKISKRRDKDPTMSKALIFRYSRDFNSRFNKLKKAVKDKIKEPGFLKTAETIPVSLSALEERRYEYLFVPETFRSFQEWLDAQVAALFLTYETGAGIIAPGGFWANTYIYTAYQKGIRQALQDMKVLGYKSLETESTSVVASFNSPFHADRVQLLYSRAFNDMKGLTETMKPLLADTLAKGMAQGIGPNQIASRIVREVDGINKVRARRIARTEIITAHVTANLNTFEAIASIIGEEVKVQWWTALDERVRSTHRRRHGVIYTLTQARSLIGEPNCRCALLPWTQTAEDVEKGLPNNNPGTFVGNRAKITQEGTKKGKKRGKGSIFKLRLKYAQKFVR